MTEPRLLVTHARIARCDGPGDTAASRLAVIDDGAVAVDENGRVVYVGPTADVPFAIDARTVDARGALLTPGLVDPHTHLVFAGRRTADFEQKMAGVDYRTIAAAGGGIMSTVRATREAAASEIDVLEDGCFARLRAEVEHGVTTVEIKSGYGLTVDDELLLLSIAGEAGRRELVGAPHRASLAAASTQTLLGAHAVPDEWRHDRAVYVRLVAEEMVPRAARERLATAVDVYLDEGAFTLEEARLVLGAAKKVGLAVKAHVGQFADLGGAELVAELGGLSCDHLEAVGEAGLRAMAAANVRAVLLPVAWRTLRQVPPDAARMRAMGVEVAVGTDCNPGTSPCLDLPLCAALAVRDAGLPADEALLAVTANAARAIGAADVGRIAVGCRGDLALWAHDDPRMFAYVMGGLRPTRVWMDGRPVVDSGSTRPLF